MKKHISSLFLCALLAFGFFAQHAGAQSYPPNSPYIQWPNGGWVPFNRGQMVTPVQAPVTQGGYGPNPLASECPDASWVSGPHSIATPGTTGANSCLDAHSAALAAYLYAPSTPAAFNTTYPYPTAPPMGEGVGAIDVEFGGSAALLNSRLNNNATGSGGYVITFSYGTDPLYCIPPGLGFYNIPGVPTLIHLPATGIGSQNHDHQWADFDTTTGTWLTMEEVGYPAYGTPSFYAAGTQWAPAPVLCSALGQTNASVIPFAQASPGATATPWGSPPPSQSVADTDAYTVGNNVTVGSTVGSTSTQSSYMNEGLQTYGTAGGVAIEWAVRAQDFLTNPPKINHVIPYNSSCEVSNNGYGVSPSGATHAAYQWPSSASARPGFVVGDDKYYCGSGVGLVYGERFWFDTQVSSSLIGTNDCDIFTYGILDALHNYGGVFMTVGSYPSGCDNTCTFSYLNPVISNDLEESYGATLTVPGPLGYLTNNTPWEQVLAQICSTTQNCGGTATGSWSIPATGVYQGQPWNSSNYSNAFETTGTGRLQLEAPGQTRWPAVDNASLPNNTGPTLCGITDAMQSHMHFLRASQQN